MDLNLAGIPWALRGLSEQAAEQGMSYAEQGTEKASASAGAAVGMAVLAMVLIYIVTENLEKIARGVDRLLGRKPDDSTASSREPIPERVEDSYKVKDIYEGELNLDDNDKFNDKKEL